MTMGDHHGATRTGDALHATDSADSTAAQRLARAFERHLSRDEFADCARVVVCDGDDGRYEYVDGVHYVTDVPDDVRDRVETFARQRRLEVVMDGQNGFAFRHETPAPDPDAHVAGAIVKTAFDASYTDLADVVEVLDATTELSWTDSPEQLA